MKLLILLAKASRRLFFIAIITSILTGISSTMIIKQIHFAVENEISNPIDFFVKFIIFILLYGIFAVISSYALTILTQNTIHKLRMNLSKKVLSTNFQEMEFKQKEILPVLTSDVLTLSYMINQLPHVLTGLATIIGVYAYLFSLSWQLTCITLGVLILLIFPLLKYTLPLMGKYSYKARTAWNTLFAQFDGLVYGLKELTLNKDMRDYFVDNTISKLSKKQNKYSIQESLAMAFSQKSMDIVLFLAIGFILFLIMKYNIVEFSFFGSYLMILMMTMSSLSTVSGFLPNFKRAETALNKIQELGIEMDDNMKPKPKKLTVQNWNPKNPLIELKNVSHQYYHQEEDRHFTLGPIDLSIYENEIVFIVGGNGSGKTTFAKMLTGLYKPKEGNLLYKGADITWSQLDQYRNQFAGLYTDFHLFDDLNYIPNEQLEANKERLLSLLLLDEKVSIEDGKYSTIKLSQGQRKRLALMTSIIEDKEIYLFDEWAANQDPQFKAIFYNDILPDLKKKGKTCIVISHDESYFKHGDRVLKIRDGQLIEEKQVGGAL